MDTVGTPKVIWEERMVPERYLACSLCNGKLRERMDSAYRHYYIEDPPMCCDCGSWKKERNDVGEKIWNYVPDKKGKPWNRS